MGEEFWKTLGTAVGGGGIVAIVAAVLKFRLSRATQKAGVHRSDVGAQSMILDRQELQIADLQTRHLECIKHHLECLEKASMIQAELGGLREQVKHVETSSKSAIAVIVANEKGIIQSWNDGATALFHWTAQDSIGKNVTLLTPERHKKKHLDAFAKIVASKLPPRPMRELYVHAVTQNGDEIPVSIRLSGWDNGNGSGWLYAAEISRDTRSK